MTICCQCDLMLPMWLDVTNVTSFYKCDQLLPIWPAVTNVTAIVIFQSLIGTDMDAIVAFPHSLLRSHHISQRPMAPRPASWKPQVKTFCLWPPILLPAYVILSLSPTFLSLFQWRRTISIIIFCSILFKLLLSSVRGIAYDATTGRPSLRKPKRLY